VAVLCYAVCVGGGGEGVCGGGCSCIAGHALRNEPDEE
jgi:hypothetical protein